jgi:uncharacterized membrane protein
MTPTTAQNTRTLVRRVAIAVGLGYLLLVVAPVTAASLLLIDAGHRLVGFGLLGGSVAVTGLGLFAIVSVWLLVRAVALALRSFLAHQRRRVLRWADDIETTYWWGPLVRPSDRLAVLDNRSAEERVEDRIEWLQARYVAGELSEAEFERGLDRLFGTAGSPSDDDSEEIVAIGTPPESDGGATERGQVVLERIR